MKKLISSIAILMLVVVLLTACGAPPQTNTSNASGSSTAVQGNTSAPAETVSIDFYYWDEPQKPGMEAMVNLFMQKNPTIKVVCTNIPWDQYWTKLQTALPAGGSPDAFWINRRVVEYSKAGLLMDINDKVAQDNVDLTPFPDTAKEICTVDGKLWAIPKDFDTIGLYYNKSLFDKAGLKYPDDTWTLDTLLENAKKLTIPGQQYGYVADPTVQGGVGNFLLEAGAKLINPDGTVPAMNTPEIKNTLQFMLDCMYKYKCAPTQAELTETTYDVQFQSEKVAMITDGSWALTLYADSLKDKLGVAPVPKVGDKRACYTNSLGFAGNAKTKYPDQVWQFLKFTATKEAQEATAANVIPAYKGAADIWAKSFPNVDAKVFLDAIDYAVRLPLYSKNSSVINTVIEEENANIWAQAKTLDQGLADMEKRMKDEFNK